MKELITNLYVKARVTTVRAKVYIKDKYDNLTYEQKSIYKKCFSAMACIAVFLFMLAITSSGFLAYTVDGNVTALYREKFNEIYRAVLPTFTIIGIVLVGYNIIVIMSSKNQRKCDTAYTWIKAIAISWMCLLLIGIFIKLAMSFFADARFSDGFTHGLLFDH